MPLPLIPVLFGAAGVAIAKAIATSSTPSESDDETKSATPNSVSTRSDKNDLDEIKSLLRENGHL